MLLPRSAVPQMTVEVRFGHERPAAVWLFRDVLPGEGFIIEQSRKVLNPDAPSHRHEFDYLKPGLEYGISWRW